MAALSRARRHRENSGSTIVVNSAPSVEPSIRRSACVDKGLPNGASKIVQYVLFDCSGGGVGPELESVSPAAMGGVDRFSRVLGRVFHRIVASLAIRLSVQIAW